MNQNFGSRQGRAFSLILSLALAAIVSLLSILAPSLDAAIVSTGNISPALPWSSSITGYIGRISDGSLRVDAGSQLASSSANIAYSSGLTGMATVTGAGSKWTNSNRLSVGLSGSGSLIIEAGGQVSNSDGCLGFNSGSTGTAIVTDTGSKWTNSNELSVGNSGSGSLTIEAGGQVSNSYGYLGRNSGSTGTATVTGTGSTWTSSKELYVGRSGSGELTVTDGGTVTAATLYASLENLHGNGTIMSTNGAVLDADLRFDAAHGTQQTYAFGSGGTLTVIANGGILGAGYKGNGSLTVAEGVTVASSIGRLGFLSGSTGTAMVTGAGSKWNNSSSFSVGSYGSGVLHIEAGGHVSNNTGYLGHYSGSTGTATITGAGSKWTNGSELYVGDSGSGELTIEAGGQVGNNTGYLGYDSGSTGTATVTGAGSMWTNSSELYVGRYGSGELTIDGGGQVSNTSGYLGYYSVTTGTGTATVTGTGSKWTNGSGLYVGYYGRGTLTIEAGGQVSNTYGYLGFNSDSTCIATVTGAGSMWTNSSDLYVGRYGSGSLTVTDGGTVTAKTLYASLENLHGNGTITTEGAVLDADLRFDAAHGNQGTVAFGSGGTLTVNANGGDFGAGYKGNGSLTVSEGVTVASSAGYLGYGYGSTGTVAVTGAGSKWTNSSILYVGNYGRGTLMIEAGGQVSNTSGYLGYVSGITGTVTVTGAGSKWTNSGLYVGYYGRGTLTIEAGGQVSSGIAYLSYDSGSTGTATITGAGSKCISGVFYVGYSGSGALTIEAGGQVSNTYGYLGFNSSSTGTATVTGAGSKWTNSDRLYVGYSGSGVLTVTDGGTVTAKTLYASLENLHGNGMITTEGAVLDADLRFDAAQGTQGTIAFGSGGTLTVNANGGDLGAGYKGNGSLTVVEGVKLASSFGYLGYDSGSTGTAIVTGAGSMWTNSSDFSVGRSGSGTLTIEAGGQVSNSDGYLGEKTGSTGTATVTGAGSTWTNNSILYVGYSGSGMLTIEAGGQVSNSDGYLGYYSRTTGTVTVTGAGSAWNNSGILYVGYSGSGTLHIRGGGKVTASSISIYSSYSSSLLTLDVGSGSLLSVGGTGTFTNSENVRILAGPQPAAGSQYAPIAAATWSGSGTYQAVGGTWNATSHVFTVSSLLASVSGTPVTIDLAQQQRVLVEDSQSGWKVGASFWAKNGTGNSFNITATAVAGADLTSLQSLLPPGQSVLSGWNLNGSGTGYVASDPVYLSLGVPAGFSRSSLRLWRFSGGAWSMFAANDLTSASGYASFTSTGLSGYAVAAALSAAAWNVNTDGVWQTGANWTTGPNAPGGVNMAALLGPAITVPRTVTLAAPLTLGLLTFDSAQHYTLSGTDELKLQVNPTYTAEIEVTQSDSHGHVIETPITVASDLKITLAPSSFLTLSGQVQNPAGQTLTLSGGGTLTVTQGIVTMGTIHVQAGTLITPSLNAGTLNIGPSASSAAAVPEPSMWVLLMACVAGGCIVAHGRTRSVVVCLLISSLRSA